MQRRHMLRIGYRLLKQAAEAHNRATALLHECRKDQKGGHEGASISNPLARGTERDRGPKCYRCITKRLVRKKAQGKRNQREANPATGKMTAARYGIERGIVVVGKGHKNNDKTSFRQSGFKPSAMRSLSVGRARRKRKPRVTEKQATYVQTSRSTKSRHQKCRQRHPKFPLRQREKEEGRRKDRSRRREHQDQREKAGQKRCQPQREAGQCR